MNQDQRLRASAKTYRYALAWAISLALLAGLILFATIHGHGKHHHVDKAAMYAVGVLAVLALLAYGICRLAAGRVSYHADRAFLARLFMQSGFERGEAQRMADLKVRRDGRGR